jgi:8-oxo-dGTP diphosphatase
MESVEQCPAVQVAVGVVRNGRGEILIARRHDHLHQGGLWEFPGGKVEPRETVAAALKRELCEELAITVERATPLIKIRHSYGDRRVLLDVWRVDAYRGDPRGQEGQPILWVSPAQLNAFEFPAANRPIVAAARLPEFYPIVDGGLAEAEALFAKLERLCQTGHTLAQWRVRGADDAAYLKLTRRAVEYCRPRGLGLLLNADPGRVMPTGAAGVHLNSRRLLGLTQRPLPPDSWVAASCHNLAEIRQAEQTGVDFVVLSPVLATPSHPDGQPLGWDRFGALADSANAPVFALGGMTRDHLAQARQAGAQGVAGIRGFDGA